MKKVNEQFRVSILCGVLCLASFALCACRQKDGSRAGCFCPVVSIAQRICGTDRGRLSDRTRFHRGSDTQCGFSRTGTSAPGGKL